MLHSLPQEGPWRQEVVSANEFHKLVRQLPDEQENNGKDFLQLLLSSGRDMVFVTEGYHKQQSVALNMQLPTAHRASLEELPAPPELHWHPAANMLHPAVQLQRELQGSRSSHKQHSRHETLHEEALPFGVTERCKLLRVQYVTKLWDEQHPQEDPNPFMQHLAQQSVLRSPVLSIRVTLQSMSMRQRTLRNQQDIDLAELQGDSKQQQDSEQQVLNSSPVESQQLFQQQRGSCASNGGHCLQECSPQAYICTLEYPLFQLQSSDYIVAADVFDRGMQQWSVIRHRDEFNMMWDDTPYLGYALRFRVRPTDDQFHTSPWRSIEVDWRDQTLDRENDPEDWCYGNPWEMVRPDSHVLAPLPDGTEIASSCKTSKAAAAAAATYAPWTAAGLAAAAAVEAAAAKRTKRQRRVERRGYLSDDFETFSALDEDMFYFDDDPEEFLLDDSTQRRKRQRQQQQRSRHGIRVHAASAVSFNKQHSNAAAAEGADPLEPKHNFGREMLGVPEGVCLVCRKSGGHLVSGHSGRTSQNCCRQYHVGCLLLLNSLGVRSVMQNKQQQRQQREVPDAAAVTAVESDGLLQELRQQQRSNPLALSSAATAAVNESAVAAVLHQQKQFDVCCPAHYCHGCGLNGKHEYMVWCCSCLLRTYHWRNCIPLGAEAVKLDDRDYIRCPACVAAGVPPPGSARNLSAAVQAEVAADGGAAAVVEEMAAIAAADVYEQPRARRVRRVQQHQQQQLELRHSNQENEVPDAAEQQQGDSLKQPTQEVSGASMNLLLKGAAAVPEGDYLGLPVIAGQAADEEAAQAKQCPQADAGHEGMQANAPDLSSRRQSPAAGMPTEQLQELEQQYQRIQALQQQYQQQQTDQVAAMAPGGTAAANMATAEAAPAAEIATEPCSLPVSHGVATSSQPAGSAPGGCNSRAVDARGSSCNGMVGSSHNSSSSLDSLMPAWVRFSLEDTERHQPSYKLVALSDSSSSGADAAAALRHVAVASTRLPHQTAEVSESSTELLLTSPQTHWLIGCTEKAESAKYKVTGSWAGCPILRVPTPDEGVYGLCLVSDHHGLVQQQPQGQQQGRQQRQQQARGAGRANGAGAKRLGRSTAAQEAPAAAVDTIRRPGVYLRCWKPVMQGSLQQQQRLLQLQQSGDERGGCAYQVLVNDKPFPEALGRQELLLQAGDVITIQGSRFQLVALDPSMIATA